MKNFGKITLAVCLMAFSFSASAQKKSDPAGSVTYCLPSTGVSIQVEAVQEKFFAGPYAKYAEKYLGVKPRQKDESTWIDTPVEGRQ